MITLNVYYSKKAKCNGPNSLRVSHLSFTTKRPYQEWSKALKYHTLLQLLEYAHLFVFVGNVVRNFPIELVSNFTAEATKKC